MCLAVFVFIGSICSQAQNMQSNQKQVIDSLKSYVNRITNTNLNLEVRKYYINLALALFINGGNGYEGYVGEDIPNINNPEAKVQISSLYHEGIAMTKLERFLQNLLRVPRKVEVDGASFL